MPFMWGVVAGMVIEGLWATLLFWLLNRAGRFDVDPR